MNIPNELATGIMIILTAIVGFICRRKDTKDNPWLLFGTYGSILALGIYILLEVPLGLPQNVAPWAFLALFLFFLVMGFFRFCKNKEKEEQAEQAQHPIE